MQISIPMAIVRDVRLTMPLVGYLNWYLARWARRKYKRFHGNVNKAYYWLSGIAQREPTLFVHWEWGAIPGMRKLPSG